MNQHFGKIELGQIENRGDGANDIGLIKACFVHYPDSQQLTIWLPQYGGQGYSTVRLIDNKRQQVLEEGLVADRLNGSVQLLWDTLGIAPGDYTIEIEYPQGGKHLLSFTKWNVGEHGPVVPAAAQEEIPSTTPIVYRDGLGNLLPDEDLLLREKIMADTAENLSRRIEYEGNFRSGHILYRAGDIIIRFYHEMAGGKYHFYIMVPAVEQWEAQTKTPLGKRAAILEFVANTVQRERVPSWHYEIKADGIYFY
ncbi:MAG: hypothetical protein H6555_08800 [Lewinellaceae bacterium]|nr:hypothetical protein [Lewinellaceae bacterium]